MNIPYIDGMGTVLLFCHDIFHVGEFLPPPFAAVFVVFDVFLENRAAA